MRPVGGRRLIGTVVTTWALHARISIRLHHGIVWLPYGNCAVVLAPQSPGAPVTPHRPLAAWLILALPNDPSPDATHTVRLIPRFRGWQSLSVTSCV